MEKYRFQYNDRLKIELPTFYVEWEELSTKEQYEVIRRWEQTRAQIPDLIKEFERMVQERELQLQIEDDNPTFIQLSKEITDYASRIIDLNLWFRTDEEVASSKIHS